MASLLCFLSYILPLVVFFVCYPSRIEARSFEIKVNQEEIDRICRQSQDPFFCEKTLKNDPGTPTANMDGLALISISSTLNQVEATLGNIASILGNITDPIGKNRLQSCKSDYLVALSKFQGAYNSSSAKAYSDVNMWVRVGTNKVIDCEDSYKREAPIGESPITVDNHNLIKLSEIIFIIVDSLLPH